ncbi:MAG: hypothetical protein MZW92_02035 [Comamonadaceae bacterium]|nr:hypothetical protein [Comamonadaceae bacterium]
MIPLEAPYAMGLILIGLAPCAPFLPMMVDRARGDMGYTASFMLLAAVGMVVTMPLLGAAAGRGPERQRLDDRQAAARAWC